MRTELNSNLRSSGRNSGRSIADDRVPVKLSNLTSFCAASRSRGQLGHASKWFLTKRKLSAGEQCPLRSGPKTQSTPGTWVASTVPVQLHLIKDDEDGDGDVPESPAAWCARLLFRALVELDGDAAVMHIGPTPHLVPPAGAIEIGECGLTAAAVETLIVE